MKAELIITIESQEELYDLAQRIGGKNIEPMELEVKSDSILEKKIAMLEELNNFLQKNVYDLEKELMLLKSEQKPYATGGIMTDKVGIKVELNPIKETGIDKNGTIVKSEPWVKKPGQPKKTYVSVDKFVEWCKENNVRNPKQLCQTKRPDGIASTPNKIYEGFSWSLVTKSDVEKIDKSKIDIRTGQRIDDPNFNEL